MKRRSFMKSITGLLLPMAPSICRADWLLPVVPRDDAGYIEMCIRLKQSIQGGYYLVSRPVVFRNFHGDFALPRNVKIQAAKSAPHIFFLDEGTKIDTFHAHGSNTLERSFYGEDMPQWGRE
jgi:hypothetical protein